MIRRRITILVLGLLAIVIGGFSTAVFIVTREAVLAEVGRDVTNRVTALAGAVGREPDAVSSAYVERFAVADVVTAVFDAEGALLARSSTLPDRTAVFRPESAGGDTIEEVDDHGPLIVATMRATTVDGGEVFVVVGRSPDRIYDTLETLARVLAAATGLTLVLGGIGAHLLLRRSLRPLERLGAETSAIADSADHAARIEGRYRADEVGELASAVDSMLSSLGEAHRLAEDASDRLRAFLAEVSHELRAPLAVALSTLDVLVRSPVDDVDGRQQLVADMRAEVERMARIVSQLLVMARSEGESRVADKPLLLAEVVRSAGRGWTTAATHDIGLVELDAIDDVVVDGNEDELRQIFDVLLDNATRYTPPGGRIRVGGSIDRGWVAVSVSDDGIGIGEHELPLVFDRFHRGTAGGTGLGLAIARHLVASHGGTITVSSTLGSGSRFVVTFPILSTTETRSPTAPLARASAPHA